MHFENSVYKNKWWTRGGTPATNDIWVKQSDCSSVVNAINAPLGLLSSGSSSVQAISNVVSKETENTASYFSVYLTVILETAKTAADFESSGIKQFLIGTLETQYGIFIPQDSIKDIMFKQQSVGRVALIADIHFDNLHDAEDGEAVMKEFEENVLSTIKQIASRNNLEVNDLYFDGASVVGQDIGIDIDTVNPATHSTPSFVIAAVGVVAGAMYQGF